ncbi:MAG: hypothetical protein Q4B81_04300 [Moraxella sp.]|nr:hypothetical protein [Moraxella sp.]
MNQSNGDALDVKIDKVTAILSRKAKEVGNYLSNTTIIFVFAWLCFLFNFFVLSDIFLIYKNLIIFFTFLLIFSFSLITIDILNYYAKTNLVSFLFLILLFSFRKFAIYTLTHDGETYDFSRGFIVGNFFYYIAPFALLPFFASFISENIKNTKKISLGIAALLFYFLYEYTIDLLNISYEEMIKGNSLYLVNIQSYIYSLLIFFFFKKNVKYKKTRFLCFIRNRYIKLFMSILGLPIFILFFLFA